MAYTTLRLTIVLYFNTGQLMWAPLSSYESSIFQSKLMELSECLLSFIDTFETFLSNGRIGIVNFTVVPTPYSDSS